MSYFLGVTHTQYSGRYTECVGGGKSLIAVYVTHVDSSVIVAWTCVIDRSDLVQQQGGLLTAKVH
jgi:hypothetical protein